MSENFKDTFFGKQFEVYNADGVDFHPIGQQPPNLVIHCSYTKQEMENKNLPIPKSGYTFWKNINGKKVYVVNQLVHTSFVVDPNAYKQMKVEKCPFCGETPKLIECISNSYGEYLNDSPTIVCKNCKTQMMLTVEEVDQLKNKYSQHTAKFITGRFKDNELFYAGLKIKLIEKWNKRC